eukprot:TRINITY_DN33039_c0_g1_i1.p1 TRINITY_DN33039_c0_g1~~TRINITY_DN33039_c0_g1_i1.p1  ORF type:complete len:109 (+),score=9.39 TRINITY_DN33039_c0_g1_i1:241-567(+)
MKHHSALCSHVYSKVYPMFIEALVRGTSCILFIDIRAKSIKIVEDCWRDRSIPFMDFTFENQVFIDSSSLLGKGGLETHQISLNTQGWRLLMGLKLQMRRSCPFSVRF